MFVKKLFARLLEEGADIGGTSGGVVLENSTSFAADTPVSSDPADDSTESDVNWSGIADELDNDDAGVEAVEGDEVVVETPAAEPPKADIPPVATPPSTPPATPPSETPATPAVTPEPQAPAQTPAEYQAWRDGKVKELEGMYAIDEDSAAALLTEPEVVLPKLAAKVHMEVLENAMRAMQAMVPVMMQQVTQHTELNTKAKNLFTSVNPDLADPAYEQHIMQFGQVYRSVNRTASPEEAARAIGALVRSALGIAQPQGQAPAHQAAAPAVATPVPFTPARGGGSGVTRAQATDNPFVQLADEFLREDS